MCKYGAVENVEESPKSSYICKKNWSNCLIIYVSVYVNQKTRLILQKIYSRSIMINLTLNITAKSSISYRSTDDQTIFTLQKMFFLFTANFFCCSIYIKANEKLVSNFKNGSREKPNVVKVMRNSKLDDPQGL